MPKKPTKNKSNSTQRTKRRTTPTKVEQPPVATSTSKPVGKKDLDGKTVFAILLACLLVFGGIAWYVLGQGDDKVVEPDLNSKDGTATAQPVDPTKGATKGNGEANTSSPNNQQADRPVWDRNVVGKSEACWSTVDQQEASWDIIDDAASDGWGTEVASDRVMSQFKSIAKKVTQATPFMADSLSRFVSEQAKIYPLAPKLSTAFQDNRIHVQRFNNDDTPSIAANPFSSPGTETLAKQMNALLADYTDRENIKVKWKVFRVEGLSVDGDAFQTKQTLELFGKTASGVREENAIWLAEWTNTDKPKLISVEVLQHERVDLKDGTMFSDCTESAVGSIESFQKQLLVGFDRWLDRRQASSSFTLLANNGLAVGDVNGDGLEDLYACQEAGLPNLLYLQNEDGSLRDASKESNVDWLQNSSAALIVDLNNDGHQDLAVGVSSGVVIAAGDSSGRFKIQNILDADDELWSLTAADFDRDGRLDLYTGTYTPAGASSVSANVVITQQYGDDNGGGKNTLFRNEIDGDNWNFSDVTESSGLLKNNHRYTFAAAWEDYDNDGDLDLYVANDFGWNNLYRNDSDQEGKVRFIDIAEKANARDDSFGMSVNWADYDRDGWMDVYISNMFSYAGNRITYQDNFKSDSTDNVKQRFQRYARGNTLLRNSGGSLDENESGGVTFEDRSLEASVNLARWAWSSCFFDINNDGWEDLFVNNGYITSSNNGDL